MSAGYVEPEGYTSLGYGKVKTCLTCGARVDFRYLEQHARTHTAPRNDSLVELLRAWARALRRVAR